MSASRVSKRPAAARNPDALRSLLNALYDKFHAKEFLGSDPLEFAHHYTDPRDQEIAALIAASFAFGNVTSVRRSIEEVLGPLGTRPAEALASGSAADWRRLYPRFTYRWVREEDLWLFLSWIGGALQRHGSLKNLWVSVDRSGEEETVLPALGRFIGELTREEEGRELAPRERWLRRRDGGAPSLLPSGAHLLLPSPAKKSGCKRPNLFLRWVVRPADGLDLGLWTAEVGPRRLIMPVDTHVLQAARGLGLTRRKAADLRTAVEITEALRQVAPEDPCRYDFALARPGILGLREEARALGMGWKEK